MLLYTLSSEFEHGIIIASYALSSQTLEECKHFFLCACQSLWFSQKGKTKNHVMLYPVEIIFPYNCYDISHTSFMEYIVTVRIKNVHFSNFDKVYKELIMHEMG